ncbi:unnamed protein product, partial [Ectocarpus sp. 12 AP-2014]
IPALPVRVLSAMLRDDRLAAGAKAELHDMKLDEIQAHAAPLRISFARGDKPFCSHFETCLGADVAQLPAPIQDLHTLIGRRAWEGKATVTRGHGFAANVVATLFRFPKTAQGIPVTVHMDRSDTSEIWVRRFGTQKFRSELTPDPKIKRRMWERFGLFTFAIDLEADETGLAFPVTKGRVLGIPIPRPLLPKSETKE